MGFRVREVKNSEKLFSVDVIRLGVSVSPEVWKSGVYPPRSRETDALSFLISTFQRNGSQVRDRCFWVLRDTYSQL